MCKTLLYETYVHKYLFTVNGRNHGINTLLIHHTRIIVDEHLIMYKRIINAYWNLMLQMGGCSLNVILVVAVIITDVAKAGQQCRDATFQKPRQGQRCVTASKKYTTVANIPEHICTHMCMQRPNCSVINYNHAHHYCQLTSEECDHIVEDAEFMVTAMNFPKCSSITESPCLRWEPAGADTGSLRVRCSSGDYVGRLVFPTDILVGQYYYDVGVWRNGNRYRSTTGAEVLQLYPHCSSSWEPYTPGDPIPSNAVLGGYLGDPCSVTPIIDGTVMSSNRGKKRCGYYNPNTRLGYIVYEGAEVTSEMSILVYHEP